MHFLEGSATDLSFIYRQAGDTCQQFQRVVSYDAVIWSIWEPVVTRMTTDWWAADSSGHNVDDSKLVL